MLSFSLFSEWPCRGISTGFLFHKFFKLPVPLLPILSYEWRFQKLKYPYAELLSVRTSGSADIPLVIIERFAAFQLVYAYRVQMAGNGLAKRCLAIEECPFDAALCDSLVIYRIGAFLVAVNKRGYVVAVAVHEVSSVSADRFTAFGGQVWLYISVNPVEYGQLSGFKGCAAFALHATGAPAFKQIANESFFYDIVRYQYVSYLKHAMRFEVAKLVISAGGMAYGPDAYLCHRV